MKSAGPMKRTSPVKVDLTQFAILFSIKISSENADVIKHISFLGSSILFQELQIRVNDHSIVMFSRVQYVF